MGLSDALNAARDRERGAALADLFRLLPAGDPTRFTELRVEAARREALYRAYGTAVDPKAASYRSVAYDVQRGWL